MRYELMVTGFPISAQYSRETVETLFTPLLRRLAGRRRDRRLIVFLAGPPAAGKSTLAAFLERLAEDMPELPRVQALGMDGFHYPQASIESRAVLRNGQQIPMQRLKGAPESFDVQALADRLERLRREDAPWPLYDRRIHDVVPDALQANAPILLVEGNYLLLDAPIWRELPHDYSVFLTAPEELLRQRLIARKIRGGLTQEQAEAFYAECDGPNVSLCLRHSRAADETWRLDRDEKLTRL